MNHSGHLPQMEDHPSSIPYPNRRHAARTQARVSERPSNLRPSHAPTPYPPQCDGRPFQSDAARVSVGVDKGRHGYEEQAPKGVWPPLLSGTPPVVTLLLWSLAALVVVVNFHLLIIHKEEDESMSTHEIR
ncbi:uncharacterized protein C2845_PM02G34260 [Panicum miliaceum]|uniref:Uncharacterized protein n=1 Tax=Panicum miliaceum TaxID=4540 RepID=A0A3L6SE92_PANMI|nr:uncharacterized protein C2845_PM02G34260 [Panicum miliaceum]